MDPTEKAPKVRWSRSQRFQLSPTGRHAQTDYCELIVSARAAAGGRESLDAARAAWATRLTLDSNDGLYLSELNEGPRTLEEVTVALEGCGPTRQDVRAAIERLVRIQLLDLVVPPVRPPPVRRW